MSSMIRRFNRFELKYVIPSELARQIARELEPNMTLDTHGASGDYRVTSLYYDSPDFACYRSKIDGILYRRKVRIRTYGPHATSDDDAVALEIKQRINRTVQKRRLRMRLGDATALIADGTLPDDLDDPLDREVATEVDFLSRTLLLRPACVISYLREAWVGSVYEPNLRVTFDRQLTVHGAEHGLFAGLPDHHFLNDTWTILEVKADDAVPLWVSHLLSRHQCTLRRVSKYCLGLDLLRRLERSPELAGAETEREGEPWTSF